MPNTITDSEAFKTSVIVPCFNEERLLGPCIDRVMNAWDNGQKPEIIIVNDGSTDNSLSVARALEKKYSGVTVVHHRENRGKGAAVRTGLKIAAGDFIAVQDADLEYDPVDLTALLIPLLSGEADMVLGSRYLSREGGRVLFFWHTLGNRVLTLLSNMTTGLNLTDMGTCYKVFRKSVLDGIDLSENRFGFDAEVIAKTARQGIRIFEKGISYTPRGYEQGKKIRIRDGIDLLRAMVSHGGGAAALTARGLLRLAGGLLLITCHLLFFTLLVFTGASVPVSCAIAFSLTTSMNHFLFRRVSPGRCPRGAVSCFLVLALLCLLDMKITILLMNSGFPPWSSKLVPAIPVQFIGFRTIPLLLSQGRKTSATAFDGKNAYGSSSPDRF